MKVFMCTNEKHFQKLIFQFWWILLAIYLKELHIWNREIGKLFCKRLRKPTEKASEYLRSVQIMHLHQMKVCITYQVDISSFCLFKMDFMKYNMSIFGDFDKKP